MAEGKSKNDEEQRVALAAKLDAELDEFMDSLEKKRYNEGWPDNRWQEELEKHPLFLKKAVPCVQEDDEVHPMLKGLQKFKFYVEESLKEKLALKSKDDGNFCAKHKKFRAAIFHYTEGIKANCENPEVQATLWNNRSAAHFFLENYGSALEDAQKAIKLNPDYEKAHIRAAQCAFELKKYDLCAELCESLLEKNPNMIKAMDLSKLNMETKLETERNLRKEEAIDKKRPTQFDLLCEALKERTVEFDDVKEGQEITEEILRPKFLPLVDHPVHFDEDDPTLLVWPAVFFYPEFFITDFQQEIPENALMEDCLNNLFKKPLACDKELSYRTDNVNVYYENREAGTLHKAYLRKTIKSIVQECRFFVTDGALLFYVVQKDSRVENEFLR